MPNSELGQTLSCSAAVVGHRFGRVVYGIYWGASNVLLKAHCEAFRLSCLFVGFCLMDAFLHTLFAHCWCFIYYHSASPLDF